jgi:hypothetical protein
VAPAEARASSLSDSDTPTSMCNVVLLPAPFGLGKPVAVPGSQRKATSETTVCAVRLFVGHSAWSMTADSQRPVRRSSAASGARRGRWLR